MVHKDNTKVASRQTEASWHIAWHTSDGFWVEDLACDSHKNSNELSRDYVAGRWVSVYEKGLGDDRLIINSLGEGAIWVCSINGDLENGDYITTCEIPGHGMKQDDDLLHNYTVAKITCDCSFDLNSSVYRCEEFQHEGVTYRRAFVGCTYHCG